MDATRPDPQRPALTLSAAARDYGLAPSTLRAASLAGDLPAHRIGRRRLRILRDELHRWLCEHPAAPRGGQAVTGGSGPGYSSAEADLRAELTELGDLEYERGRGAIAEQYGARVTLLDRLPDEEQGHRDGRGGGIELESPDPWPDEVDGAELLGELTAALRRFVVLDEPAQTAKALWVLHAHAHEAASISPIPCGASA